MSETTPNTYLDIDPNPERTPVLPGMKYGENGEATLEKLRQFDDNGQQHVVKFGRDAGKPCIKMQVSILTREYGFVHLFDDLLLEGAGQYGKNRTLRFLNQLGIDPTATRDPATGRSKLDVSSIEKSKIIVDLSYREWDEKDRDTGELTGARRSANGIKNVWKRP